MSFIRHSSHFIRHWSHFLTPPHWALGFNIWIWGGDSPLLPTTPASHWAVTVFQNECPSALTPWAPRHGLEMTFCQPSTTDSCLACGRNRGSFPGALSSPSPRKERGLPDSFQLPPQEAKPPGLRLPCSLIHCFWSDSSLSFPVNNNKHWEEAQGPSLAQHVLKLNWKGKPITQRALKGQREGEEARIHTGRARPWGLGECAGGSADIYWGQRNLPTLACSLTPAPLTNSQLSAGPSWPREEPHWTDSLHQQPE